MSNVIHAFEGTTCVEAWLGGISYLLSHANVAYNVVLGIETPEVMSPSDANVQARVSEFLVAHDASPLSTVASTIFPAGEYLHSGASGVYEEFPKVFATIKDGWGTYAMRLLTKTLPATGSGNLESPLEHMISKMRTQRKAARMRAVYEVSLLEQTDFISDIPLYDATTDRKLVRGGPCLSHLSFKLIPDGSVCLTALYRSHYYVRRALGNLFGLAQLLSFVAAEVGVRVGSLACHSTYAVVDTEGWTISSVRDLIAECNQISLAQQATKTPESLLQRRGCSHS